MNPNKPMTEKVNPQMDIKQTQPVKCDACQSQAFQDAMLLRNVSAILSPSGKAGILPIPVFACIACGHINQQFLPPELRENKIVKSSIIS